MTNAGTSDADFWNERYQSSHRIWSGNPNPQLVAEVSDLAPAARSTSGVARGPMPSGWRDVAGM